MVTGPNDFSVPSAAKNWPFCPWGPRRWRRRYGAAYATIHRADLHGLLLSAVTQYTDAQLHLEHAIDSFADAGGVVTVRTSRGKEVEGDALIGAGLPLEPHTHQLLGAVPPRVTGWLFRTRDFIPEYDKIYCVSEPVRKQVCPFSGTRGPDRGSAEFH